MNTILIRIVLIVICLASGIKNGQARRFFVDITKGNDEAAGDFERPWRDLRMAIDRLEPGDTLLIREGDYTGLGQIVFQKEGTETQPVVIGGYQGEYPFIHGITIGFSSWVTISSLALRGPKQLPDGWIDMPAVVVDDPEIDANQRYSWLAPDYRIDSVLSKYETYAQFFNYGYHDTPTWESVPTFGVNVTGSSDITISNCYITMHTYGIRLANESRRVSVIENNIEHCLDGISAFCNVEEYAFSFAHSSISNNRIRQSFRNGIMLNYGANHSNVVGNEVFYTGQNHIGTYNLDIRSDSAGYNRFENNLVAFGGYYGEFMEAPGPSAISMHSPGPECMVIGNLAAYQVSNARFENNLSDGNCFISDNNPHGSYFVNNVCWRPMGNGVSIVKSSSNLIIHNTIIQAGFRDSLSRQNGISVKVVEEEDINNIIANNIFSGAARGGIFFRSANAGSQAYINHNLYYHQNSVPIASDGAHQSYTSLPYMGFEQHGLNTKPWIVDSTGNLYSNSPAIGAGTSTYSYPVDHTGTARHPQNPTIGAHETYLFTNVEHPPQIPEYVISYPNPVSNILHISLSNKKRKLISNNEIKIYDVLGRLVLQKTVSQTNEIQIEISNFETGLYFLEINNNEFKSSFVKL